MRRAQQRTDWDCGIWSCDALGSPTGPPKNLGNGASWLRRGTCLTVHPGFAAQLAGRTITMLSALLAADCDVARLHRGTTRRENVPDPRQLADRVSRQHRLISCRTRSMRTMNEAHFQRYRRRTSVLVCRFSRVHSITDHHTCAWSVSTRSS